MAKHLLRMRLRAGLVVRGRPYGCECMQSRQKGIKRAVDASEYSI